MPTTYTVKQGDCLASIARSFGFARWQTLHDHPDNADLKKKRPNPNLLHPGDQVVIPDRDDKALDCAAGKTHRFKVKQPRSRVRVVLKGPGGEALADKRYELSVAGETFRGTTDGAGKVEHVVPEDAVEGELKLWPGGALTGPYTWKLRIGHLDPHDEITGVQARLRNLGFDPGAVDGVVGDRTRRALRAFQKKSGLTVSGEIDDATRAKLRGAHDG